MIRPRSRRGAWVQVSPGLLGTMVGTIALAALLRPPAAVGSTPQIQITPAQPVPGERVTVQGSGFCPAPCSPVTVAVDGSVAAGGVAVASDGSFEVSVGLAPVAGTSTIAASQTDGSGTVRQATATVELVASDQTGPTPTAPAGGMTQPPASSPPPRSDLTAQPSPQIRITPAQPIPGERVTVLGSGFCPAPCSPVTVTVDGSVAAGGVAVAADGSFEVAVGLAPVAGTSTIAASQTDAAGAVRQATATVELVASDQTAPTPSVRPSGMPIETPVSSPVDDGLLGTVAPAILIVAAVGGAIWLLWRRRMA